jgi:DNA invertase Pin-like site-specific DNA recombinase
LSRFAPFCIERIAVATLDRLTRSVRDLGELIDLCSKRDVALVSVGETLDTSTAAAARMVVNMLGVVAQWEREAIAERTATSLAHKRRERYVYGSTPFGYIRQDKPRADCRGASRSVRGDHGSSRLQLPRNRSDAHDARSSPKKSPTMARLSASDAAVAYRS